MKQWQVHWVPMVPKAVPGHLTLEGWDRLEEREAAIGFDRGDPFLTDPDFRVDARLSRFYARSSFARLAPESKRNYTTDHCLFFNFLWQRGKAWFEATRDDLLDYEDWRRRSPQNPVQVSGGRWNRELAALQLLYRWAVNEGHLGRNPITMREATNRQGEKISVPTARAKDVRSSNVKWLTPRAFRLWRDVGLRGYTPEGRADPSWRGRHDDRNAAYADLLFSTGLRRSEGGSLLTIEIPALAGDTHRFYDARLAAAVAKSRRPRTFYLSLAALRATEAYAATTRRAAVRRAQGAGVYERLEEMWLVTHRTGRQGATLHWHDRRGRAGRRDLNALSVGERRLLFVEGPAGPEPLSLWLAENGLPMGCHSWEAVFRAASLRCGTQLGGRVAEPPFCTPHMCRHSMALHMLVALHHAMDRKFDLSPEERRDYQLLYGDPWRMVKDLLGHSSVEVTRNIYLAPVADLQLRSLLVDDDLPDVSEILSRLSQASERVLDVEVGA